MKPWLGVFAALPGVAFALAQSPDSAAAVITAVPPAAYVAPPVEKAAIESPPFLDAASKTIALPAPSAKEITTLKALNASGPSGEQRQRVHIKARALAIGIARDTPALERLVRGSDLIWTSLTDGARAARLDVQSSGAAGVRLALTMALSDPDLSVRFTGSSAAGAVFGPYPANRIAEISARDGAFWSPVLEGDVGSIELYAPAGVPVDAITLTVLRVSHLAVAGVELYRVDPKDVRDIGLAGPCELDVACVANASQALLNTAKSVAKMVFTKETGVTYECTGTLINDSVASFAPYFYTADHCIDSQYAAANLNTYWFFDAIACNSKAKPPFVLLTGGAMLLGRSEDYDWALLRLRDAPPPGAQFSAWRADPVQAGEAAGTMHHPQGDLKKWSQGIGQGFHTFNDGSTFAQMRWNQGSTEDGSSGAGLFTFLQSGGYYELRGGLFGGDASCTNAAAPDNFSRVDKALPVLRQYLTPNVANPNGEVPIVEFYNKTLDHYFMSSNPAEINDLDAGVHAGWERTGFRFLGYGDAGQAPAGATPVCRFYMRPGVGDSHFYSADPAECAATADRFGASWIYESPAVFWIQLPNKVTGACPANTHAVYRFFNTLRTNHRYTAEVDVRNVLKTTPGWIAEGYGPQATIMCPPND